MTVRRYTALIVAALLGGVAVLIALAALGLGTERGSRWLLAHAPGVDVEGFQGRLGSQWTARQLVWSDGGGGRITVEAPRLAWRPSCLFRLALCIDELAASQIAVIPGKDATASSRSEPLTLPRLKLPLALEVGRVEVGEVRYGDDVLLGGLHLAADWNASGLRVGALHLVHSAMTLDLQGTLRPDGDWPLDVQWTLALPAIDDRPWQVTGTAQGALGGTLQLAARSSGYLEASLDGTLQPLVDHLPATLRLKAAPFLATHDLPPTLELRDLALSAEGDLQNGYQLQANASLPGQQGPVAVLLRGKVDAEGAQLAELSLAADPQHRVGIMGVVGWADEIAGEATADWQDFPWPSLYPVQAPPAVSARRVKALVRYGAGQFLGNLEGDFAGPAGPFTLSTPFSGDPHHLVLPQLQLAAGKGQLTGQVKLDFTQGIGWDADLALAGLDPAYWVAALPGKLAGALVSGGRWQGGVAELKTRLDIRGQLRGQAARLQGTLEGQGSEWRLSALEAVLGANRLAGQGTSGALLKADIALDAPRLDQLWPGLTGTLNSRLSLGGRLDRPEGQLQLNGQRLAWQGDHVSNLSLMGRLDARQQGVLSLKASGVATAGTELGTLSVEGSGTLGQHGVRLALEGPTLKVGVAADGAWRDGMWKGRLSQGRVAAGTQAWAMQSPATLQRLADGTVQLGAHCWRSGPASLCADEQRLAPEPRIRLRLRDFPLASLQPQLPPEMVWSGTASADVLLDVSAAGPRGTVTLDASNGTLSVRQGEQTLAFPYGALHLDSKIDPRRVTTTLGFDGRKLGQLHLQADIDPFGAEKPVTGSFRVQGLDIAVFRPLLDQAERLAGRVEGSGQLSGTLMAPRVDGLFSLTGGALAAPGLPLGVDDMNLKARMSGDHLQLDGGWRSGSKGQGQLSGELAWDGPLRLDLALRASDLPIAVAPYAQVEAGADLHLGLIDQKLALTGRIRVPRGSITVRQLPPSTVKVSNDAIVVGRETRASASTAIAMDVTVDVGEETLTFSGFGLQSDIAGKLHIGDDLDTRGSLELRNGRYRAYGQRLTLRRARLFFTGPIDQPYLDVEAIRQTGDVIAGIRLSGSAQQPTSEVFAEPAMSQEQALSWLVLGRPLSSGGEDNNLLAQAALGLGLMGSASTTGKLAKSLGIQDFQLDTEGSGTTTSVVASGSLTDRLTLRYGVGVFEPASTVALRYALTRQLYLEAAGGVASSLDVFYKKDF